MENTDNQELTKNVQDTSTDEWTTGDTRCWVNEKTGLSWIVNNN